MTILLGGGGSADDERPVLDRFLDLVQGGPIAYWPIALDLDDYTDATTFAEHALGRRVITWLDLDSHQPEHLSDHLGVFIGGGNTYHLLREVRRCGFAHPLRAFAFQGVLYGGSAGAVIFGADIDSSAGFDSNEVGLTDTTGLDLLGGYSVWCHFVPDHRADIMRWTQAVVGRSSDSPGEPASVQPARTHHQQEHTGRTRGRSSDHRPTLPGMPTRSDTRTQSGRYARAASVAGRRSILRRSWC